MSFLKAFLRSLFDQLERLWTRLFGARNNPFASLGALGWLLFWIVTISGIYVYIFFDTGVTQAWASLEALAREQPLLGGVMRSLHRYASDALVVVVLVHLLREFALDRLRGNRWFAWFTGVLLLGFVYVCGITGYWLVWDELAQYVAIVTSEWLDDLGLFAEPIARNFLASPQLSGRFFTLMVYIHIAVPLFMLLFMWVHIQRHAHARVNPPRVLAIGTTLALVVLALVLPAASQPPADLDRIPFSIGLDWFYLSLYPLLDLVDGRTLWLALGAAMLLLAALPWLPPWRSKPVAARVQLPECNGCARCFEDCPFGAITMLARSDGLPFQQEARVDPDLCMSCGICVGACPTATPFRMATALVPGIELPAHPLAELRERVRAAGAGMRAAERNGEPCVLVFGCSQCGNLDALAAPGVSVLRMPCIGMLPPSFVDFALSRRHADGVFLAACAENACHERLGERWTYERLSAQRDPYLRERVPRERVALSRESRSELARRRTALESFRATLRVAAPLGAASTPRDAATSAPASRAPWRARLARWPLPLRYGGQAVAYGALAALVGFFATRPAYTWLGGDQSTIKLSFSHAAQPLKPCRRYTAEELAKLPFEKRSATNCERGRWPVHLELDVDGRPMHRGVHRPAGLWDDGPSSVYLRFALPAGTHRFEARLRDSGRAEGFDHTGVATVRLVPGQNFVIDFRAAEGGFRFGAAGVRGSEDPSP